MVDESTQFQFLGSVERIADPHLGYGQIAGRYVEQLDRFNREVLSPYRDYHRPYDFPSEERDARGKVRKRYRQQDLLTPYSAWSTNPLPTAHSPLPQLHDLDPEVRMSRNGRARSFSSIIGGVQQAECCA